MESPSFPFTFNKICTLGGHTQRVWCCAWSPGGTALATCGSDKTIRIWKKQTPISPNTRPDPSVASTMPVGGVVAQTWPEVNIPSSLRTSLVEAPLAASVDPDSIPEGTPVSVNDWTCIQVLDNAHTRSIRAIAWSPSGRHIASASFDHSIVIWELLDGVFECVAVLKGHENEVKSVCWSGSGEMIVTCSRDKTIWVWQDDGDNDWECISVLTGHTGDIKSVQFNPHNDDIISCSYDDTIRFWTTTDDDWYNTSTLAEANSTVWDFAFDKSFTCLATVSDDKMLRVYSKRTKHQLTEEEYDDDEYQAYITSDGEREQSTADADSSGREWMLQFIVPAGDRSLYSVDWSQQFQPPQQTTLGGGSAAAVPGGDEQTNHLVYSTPSGEYFLSLSHQYGLISTASGDNNISLFDTVREITNPQDITYIEASEAQRPHIANISHGLDTKPIVITKLSDDGDIVLKRRRLTQTGAGASADTSRFPLLDAANRSMDAIVRCAHLDNAHQSDVNCLRFNPKIANLVATVGDDAGVHIWRILQPSTGCP